MPVADYHEQFAAVYDLFYGARDIGGDVRLATELLDLRAGDPPSHHVLDFGCGTGSHVLAFGAMGIRATGIDRSPAMIVRARCKSAPAAAAPVAFVEGGPREWDAALNGERYNGVVSFFNVLNCMESPAAMVDALKTLAKRLMNGGRLLVDVWNGAAVYSDDPRPTVRDFVVTGEPDRKVTRITVPVIDRVRQCCRLQYRVVDVDRRNGRFTEHESVHDVRFLTPVQYRHIFELAGLAVLNEFPKGRPGVPITEADWYISYLLSGAT
ncbi:MAG: class I SAM-dependent methyltransferase [Phycisphaerales bacterium]|nr:class I SAM-dependent methyltransferase [Phycisphaerales bacterium]